MAAFRIAVIGGDGIGPEVIDQAVRVAERAATRHDTVPVHEFLLPMRRRFDQYVNLRPAYLFAGVPCPLRDKAPGSIDMLVYRENTEGEYAPVGGRVHQGTA